MRKILQTLLLLCCLGPIAATQAAADDAVVENEATDQTDGESQDAQRGVKKEKKGWSGMTIFLLVFTFSVLFLISTATALNRLGGKPPPRPKSSDTSPRKKAKTGKERFRL